MSKRPVKKTVVDFLTAQFACITEEVPFITEEIVAKQVEHGNYFLYKGEVEGVCEKMTEKDSDFDEEKFVTFLVNVDAVREGSAPAFGERGTTIDSREKALEVAANPEDEQEVAEIMQLAKIISDSRKAINKKLAKGVTLGVGFNSGARNKAKAKLEAAAGEDQKVEAEE